MKTLPKFKRGYKLEIETESGQLLTYNDKLHMSFDISRQLLANTNQAQIEIYNLNEINRNQIKQDRIQLDVYRQVRLSVGYENNLALIFQGNIQTAQSFKEGTDFITRIIAQDGLFAYANSFTDVSISNETGIATYLKVNTMLMQDLQKVTIGFVAPNPEPVPKRGLVLSGKTVNLLEAMDGYNFFIDDEQAFLVDKDQVRYTLTKLIDSSTGLLNTPVAYDNYLQVNCLLYPDIALNEMLTLYSTSAPQWNGEYKVLGIDHKGSMGYLGPEDQCVTTLKLDLLGKFFATIRI